MQFCDRYRDHFIGQGRNSVDHARCYVSGLLGAQRRKNIETIENDVSGSDYQGMEQFISSSPWAHRALLDDVARDANELLGDREEAGLYIDESSFLKKGTSSVGVQRQWSAGREGGELPGWGLRLPRQEERLRAGGLPAVPARELGGGFGTLRQGEGSRGPADLQGEVEAGS